MISDLLVQHPSSACHFNRHCTKGIATYCFSFFLLFLTFFGRHSFFFFLATKPQSTQRKSPGLASRIGLPCWHVIGEFLVARGNAHYNTVDSGGDV